MDTPARCCIGWSVEAIKLLLAAPNIEVNKTNIDGATPLLVAVSKGHAPIVQALLDKNADVTLVDKEGGTLLHWAAYKGNLNVVQILLAAPNIEVHKTNIDGATPLHTAAQNGHTSVVQALLEKNAEIDKCNAYGSTALIVAAHLGRLEAVQTLLLAGANPDITTNKDFPYNYTVSLSNGILDIHRTKDFNRHLLGGLKAKDYATETYNQLEILLKGVVDGDPHLQTYKNRLNDYIQIILLLSQHSLSIKKARNADDADLKPHSPKRMTDSSDSPFAAAAAALIVLAKSPSPNNSPLLHGTAEKRDESASNL